MSETAVCLVSGGLDSCVTLAVAASRGHALALLHVTYGQPTANRETRAFHEIADCFRAGRKLSVDISHLRMIGGSALTDPNIELPAGQLDRIGIPTSYVPFRNGNLLSIATSWAETLGARHIFVGAVEEDSSGYPDCRGSFFEAFERAISAGTRPETEIKIEAPLLHLRKKEIVELGIRLNAPLHLTWSCYVGRDRACGVCDSCLLRLRGFQEAGVEDPIPYEVSSPPLDPPSGH